MLDPKPFIEQKLHQYGSIPSTPGRERILLEHLHQDFIQYGPSRAEQWWYMEKCSQPYFSLLLNAPQPVNYLFTVHTDRVPDWITNKPYSFVDHPTVSTDELVTGQLDNTLSLAILRYLYELFPTKIHILFTTREEVRESWEQLKFVMDAYPEYHFLPVSVDIDICEKLEDFNSITLRTRDNYAGFDKVLVEQHLRQSALKHNIPFSVDEVGNTAVETGFLNLYTDGKYKGAHIGVPLTNFHTNEEVTKWPVILDAVRLLQALITDSDPAV
jgi:hypothetical protein